MRKFEYIRKYFLEISMLVVVLIWSSNNSVIKIGISEIGTFTYNALRLSIASILCWLWLYKTHTYKKMPWHDLKALILLSLCGFCLTQICLTYGLSKTTAGNASLASAIMPLAVVLLNRIFKKIPLSKMMTIGIILSFSGVLSIIFSSNKEISFSNYHLIGTLIVVFGQFSNAYYTIYAKDLLNNYSSCQIVSYLMSISAVVFFILAIPEMRTIDFSSLSNSAWISVFYSGIFALWLCNIIWVYAVGQIGSTRTALYQYLLPVCSLWFAYILLDETLVTGQIIGTILILIGLIISRK
ncbi:DMT family transporter [Megamonas hypermegale]|uniref:DMT family transporter n=1 Tax=Megamonas hypermegale TaxID=158847 RepID=UPI001EF6624A|nr:DMT family transporter [Megamonas hypermegale]